MALTAFAEPTTAPSNATDASKPAAAAADDKTKYCIVDATTGSRMPRKTCRTRKEWARAGVDVDQARSAD